jgi:hypothetical protein
MPARALRASGDVVDASPRLEGCDDIGKLLAIESCVAWPQFCEPLLEALVNRSLVVNLPLVPLHPLGESRPPDWQQPAVLTRQPLWTG